MTGSRPNLLYIFSDQHRGSALGSVNPDINTPNINRLSQEGTRFNNVYTNYPLCSPSRASLLSGQYPLTHGVITNDLQLPAETISIGNIFNNEGYRTGYIGKWHLDGWPYDKFTPPGKRRQGFDDYWAVYNSSHQYFDAQYYRNDPKPIEIDKYEPIAQTDLAIEFIQKHESRPFCLFLSWGPPHDPYDKVPEKYKEQYDPNQITPQPNVEPILPSNDSHPAPAQLSAPPVRRYPFSPQPDEPYPYDHPREGIADYYAQITALDEQLGRILTALDNEGITEETIVVYSSDHGDMLWSHGTNQKGQPHEEAINIPFIIRWPGNVSAGETDGMLMDIVDIAPTVAGLAGIEPNEEMEGSNRSKAIIGEADMSADSVFIMNLMKGWRAIRTEQYTYARVHDGYMQDHVPVQESDWLLFDNVKDPYQLRNRVYDPEYEVVRSDLSDRLDRWLSRLDDPFHGDFEKYLEKIGRKSEYEDTCWG